MSSCGFLTERVCCSFPEVGSVDNARCSSTPCNRSVPGHASRIPTVPKSRGWVVFICKRLVCSTFAGGSPGVHNLQTGQAERRPQARQSVGVMAVDYAAAQDCETWMSCR